MREISVKVYKFSELDEDIQEALIAQSMADIDLDDDIESHLDDYLSSLGLKGITVDNFSFGNEEVPDHVYLSGELNDTLSYWDKYPESQNFSHISNGFLSEEDASDDNPCGLTMFFKDSLDDESEEAKTLTNFFIKEFNRIEEQVVEEGQKYFEKTLAQLEKKIQQKLAQNEYFADGTLFDEDLMID